MQSNVQTEYQQCNRGKYLQCTYTFVKNINLAETASLMGWNFGEQQSLIIIMKNDRQSYEFISMSINNVNM